MRFYSSSSFHPVPSSWSGPACKEPTRSSSSAPRHVSDHVSPPYTFDGSIFQQFVLLRIFDNSFSFLGSCLFSFFFPHNDMCYVTSPSTTPFSSCLLSQCMHLSGWVPGWLEKLCLPFPSLSGHFCPFCVVFYGFFCHFLSFRVGSHPAELRFTISLFFLFFIFFGGGGGQAFVFPQFHESYALYSPMISLFFSSGSLTFVLPRATVPPRRLYIASFLSSIAS